MKMQLPKTYDDIQNAQLLNPDWYEMRLVKEPEVVGNKVLRDFAKENNISVTDVEGLNNALAQANAQDFKSADGKFPSINWKLHLVVVAPEDPSIDGRPFKVYLPLPNDKDKDRFTPLGQSLEDSKMERIMQHVEAFSGSAVSGDEAEISQGDSAMFYVVSEYDEYFQQNRNSISINEPPQPVM